MIETTKEFCRKLREALERKSSRLLECAKRGKGCSWSGGNAGVGIERMEDEELPGNFIVVEVGDR